MTNFIISKDYLLSYFQKFSSQDLEGLSAVFSDQISLIDWDLNCIGKSQVLQAVSNIYDSIDSISAHPLQIILDVDNNCAACFLHIFIGSDAPLKVVDFIRVDDVGKIVEISAYKQ